MMGAGIGRDERVASKWSNVAAVLKLKRQNGLKWLSGDWNFFLPPLTPKVLVCLDQLSDVHTFISMAETNGKVYIREAMHPLNHEP